MLIFTSLATSSSPIIAGTGMRGVELLKNLVYNRFIVVVMVFVVILSHDEGGDFY